MPQYNIAIIQFISQYFRTFPDHIYYRKDKGIKSLRRVLNAYALHNKKVGYVQSMNFIAGFLLLLLSVISLSISYNSVYIVYTIIVHYIR